jgi:signal peptidase I
MKKPTQAKSARGARPPDPKGQGKAATKTSGRESIESFVVVFMAFLVWSIEAEGFVVPTGSMAPTLMGRHKEIVCPQCGYRFTVNADREVEPAGDSAGSGARIDVGTCENCRFECQVGEAPSFSGDRIYVMKDGVSLPFFATCGQVKLRRWDVAVFKLPEEPEVRYIKRLVGMSDEVIRIEGGDLSARPLSGSGEFRLLRRPLEHQQAMQQIVYDDAHRATALRGDPRWSRFSPERPGEWAEPDPGAFVPARRAGDWVELVYRHLVPAPEQWKAIATGSPPGGAARPTLITDYCSYNTDLSLRERGDGSAARSWFQPNWVGDLSLSLRLEVHALSGRIRLELMKGGRSNRCEIDLATGKATLYHDKTVLAGDVQTAITRAGTYGLTLANVDGRLTLWVDGALPFGAGCAYESAPRAVAPTASDLEPVRIGAQNAGIRVEGLILKRDIYYTLDPGQADYAALAWPASVNELELFEILSDPAQFSRLAHRPAKEYPIQPGHYLMLGDNSARSRDGRAWGQFDRLGGPIGPGAADDSGSSRASWEVPESLLVGKAFWVYWPHAKPVWPEVRVSTDIRLPILPYIERMRVIR